MRSPRAPSAWWLPRKDWRELVTSRPFLLFAVLMAPLVGHSFVFAVATYAEVSGAGGASALAQGVSPLDGIVVPTFGAYAVAISLLFPFAAIRLVSSEKETGGLDLLLQSRHSLTKQIVVKFAVLLGAWIVAWIPGLVALALWRGYGGHLHAPETMSVLLGHVLRAALVVSVAVLASSVTEGAAAAAVLTLAFTLASWALDFVAQVQGGLMQQIADLAPQGMLRAFERGEIRLDVIAVLVVTVASNLAVAIVWMHPGRQRGVRWAATVVLLIVTTGLTAVAGDMRASWDVSEDRRSSFSPAAERALARVRAPVKIEVNLAPEDPRLADLDREVLRKLRRTLVDVTIVNTSRSTTGLFEPRAATGELRPGYGEVWYQVGAKRAMSRSTTGAIVLELIYSLADVATPAPDTSRTYPGYPLATQATFAPVLFYLAFPALIGLAWWWYRKPGHRT